MCKNIFCIVNSIKIKIVFYAGILYYILNSLCYNKKQEKG